MATSIWAGGRRGMVVFRGGALLLVPLISTIIITMIDDHGFY